MMGRIERLLVFVLLILLCVGHAVIGEEKSGDIFSDMDIKPEILAAMQASRGLSGGEFNRAPDGGFFYSNKNRNYAYAYYGEPIAGLYADAASENVLALMEDGRVYNGTTLISGNAEIWDVRWKTHTTNIDAYMLGRDGGAYYYDPYKENRFVANGQSEPCSAICRSGSYVLYFLKDGGIVTPSMLMSGGSDKLSQEHIDYWKDVKNIVVGACIASDSGDFNTIAGISADGTVYASGEFAEDILALGELCYIDAGSNTYTFACIGSDHTLKFAGTGIQKVEVENSGIMGLRLLDDTLWIVDEAGNIYEADIESTNFVPEYALKGTKGLARYRRMDADGNVYKVDVGTGSSDDGYDLFERTQELNAGFGDHTRMLYYLEVLDGKMLLSTDFAPGDEPIEKKSQLALMDLDADGTEELIISGEWDSGVAGIYNSKLTHLCSDLPFEGNPETGVFGAYSPFSRGGTEVFYQMRNGRPVDLVSKYVSSDSPETMYWIQGSANQLPMTDAAGKALRQDSGSAISETEFEALLQSVLAGGEMREYSFNWFDQSREQLSENLFDGNNPDEVLKRERESAGELAIDWASVNVGDKVDFGHWEQDNIDNGPENITWEVLEKADGKALLLSEKVIDAYPYFIPEATFQPYSDFTPEIVNDRGLVEKRMNVNHMKSEEYWATLLVVTWEKSDLRAWLNADFFEGAFSDAEKAQVLSSVISTPADNKWTNGCPDTLDKVFVLKWSEIENYGRDYFRARSTAYADERTNSPFTCYWLRTNMAEEADAKAPGIRLYNVYHLSVQEAGEEVDYGHLDDYTGVRPAIWVRIDGGTSASDAIPGSTVEEEAADLGTQTSRTPEGEALDSGETTEAEPEGGFEENQVAAHGEENESEPVQVNTADDEGVSAEADPLMTGASEVEQTPVFDEGAQSKTQGDDWRAGYYDFIQAQGYTRDALDRLQLDETRYRESIRQNATFALHDMDGNGEPELLISLYEQYGGDPMCVFFYRYGDAGVEYLNGIRPGCYMYTYALDDEYSGIAGSHRMEDGGDELIYFGMRDGQLYMDLISKIYYNSDAPNGFLEKRVTENDRLYRLFSMEQLNAEDSTQNMLYDRQCDGLDDAGWEAYLQQCYETPETEAESPHFIDETDASLGLGTEDPNRDSGGSIASSSEEYEAENPESEAENPEFDSANTASEDDNLYWSDGTRDQYKIEPTGYVEAISGDTHVRTGPGRGYESIGVLKQYQSVPFTGKVEYDERPVAWYSVEWDHREAWVSSKYTTVR